MLILDQITKDIQFLKTCKAFQQSKSAFILHDKKSRSRRRYIKQNNEWIFSGIFNLDEISKLYKDAKNS